MKDVNRSTVRAGEPVLMELESNFASAGHWRIAENPWQKFQDLPEDSSGAHHEMAVPSMRYSGQSCLTERGLKNRFIPFCISCTDHCTTKAPGSLAYLQPGAFNL